MRPRLRHGVAYAWRSAGQLQVGITDPLPVSSPGVVICGVRPSATRLLDMLDGTVSEAELALASDRHGLDPDDVRTILAELARGGLLTGTDDDGTDGAGPRPGTESGKGGGVGDRHDPTRRRTRAACGVTVYGTGRIGSLVASLLAAAGVGRIRVHGSGEVTALDCVPGGARPTDIGRPRAAAALDAVRRASPGVRAHEVTGRAGTDCAVFADGARPDGQLARSLVRGATPHLFADAEGTVGRVGPLVVPGLSTCLECVALHRGDLDPGWQSLRRSARSRPRRDPVGGFQRHAPASLVAVVAGAAAGQVLALLEGAVTETVGAVWEVHDGSLRARRQIWPPHPECRCGAGRGIGVGGTE